MSKKCYVCHKKPMVGRSISRRGLAKKVGGVGKKITSTTKRIFHANLQSRRISEKGETVKVFVCTKCIKAGKLVFVSR